MQVAAYLTDCLYILEYHARDCAYIYINLYTPQTIYIRTVVHIYRVHLAAQPNNYQPMGEGGGEGHLQLILYTLENIVFNPLASIVFTVSNRTRMGERNVENDATK